jgi:hypothetical protein
MNPGFLPKRDAAGFFGLRRALYLRAHLLDTLGAKAFAAMSESKISFSFFITSMPSILSTSRLS